MKFPFPRQRCALPILCAVLLAGCQSQQVALSPPMRARVVDGETGRPLENVQVTLLSRDAPESLTAYSDRAGSVVMPELLAPDHPVERILSDTSHTAAHAIFQRPGYETYEIDAVTGYGFFRGHTAVRLFPE